jgi:hypothetical protein
MEQTTPEREPSIFDLLEPLSAKLVENGGPDIRGGFARGTGGADLPFIIEAIESLLADKARLLTIYNETDHSNPDELRQAQEQVWNILAALYRSTDHAE